MPDIFNEAEYEEHMTRMTGMTTEERRAAVDRVIEASNKRWVFVVATPEAIDATPSSPVDAQQTEAT